MADDSLISFTSEKSRSVNKYLFGVSQYYRKMLTKSGQKDDKWGRNRLLLSNGRKAAGTLIARHPISIYGKVPLK